MKKTLALSLAAALISLSWSSPEPVAPTAKTEQPAGIVLPAGGRRIEHAQVRMRDGARLNADAYLPAASGRFPVVLIRTPYKTEIGPRPLICPNSIVFVGDSAASCSGTRRQDIHEALSDRDRPILF